MHLVADQVRSLDETARAIDLGQTAGEVAVLSFSDSDLGLVAHLAEAAGDRLPSLRLAALADLRHPYSVDLWLDAVGRRARFVLVRLLGGMDYWRYGVDELANAARTHGFDLAIVPGDGREDERLDRASTLPVADLRRLWAFFQEGGPDNVGSALGWIAARLGHTATWREPEALPAHGEFVAARRPGAGPLALLTLYRSVWAAADTAPIVALADALAARGLRVRAEFVASLKDARVVAGLGRLIEDERPAIVVNTTAFSARLDDGTSVLDRAGVPVVQAILATSARDAWAASTRGLSAADLAMNVVLPEVDGRIAARAISFKDRSRRSETLQHACSVHVTDPDGVAAVADLAAAWVRLAATARCDRRVGLVVSDYPAKGGRTAYAVGLDTPASIVAIVEDLAASGYDVAAPPAAAEIMARLEGRAAADGIEDADDMAARLSLADYREHFARLPAELRAAIEARWGDPCADANLVEGAFRFPHLGLGRLTIAVQPDRGRRTSRKSDYHDATIPPRHGYVAFHVWLREVVGLDAMIHLGTHGTLEWLPGKAAAPSPACAPTALLGPMPVVYPFVVNNPGEAAQAKRRIAAVTVGHMTPPLARAGSHGAAAEIEALLDEFSQAQTLDARRARLLARTVLERARDSGLAEESGISTDLDEAEALTRLDAWLCDLKDARISDGLHVFARTASPALREAAAEALGEGLADDVRTALPARLAACAAAERDGLLAALDGRFVAPGPAGAPARGRLDVMPTGRNLYAVDPRGVPTRTAWEIGRRTAEEVVARHVQDHGDWPRAIVLDLWGSATMRTGGDDLAQAFALMGVRPLWDGATARVSGFEILVPAKVGRPRVDVTLRISGLFRDVFEAQIALFDEAARAVAALEEDDEDNPLAARRRAGDGAVEAGFRVFGAAPGAYGVGLATTLATGAWESRDELGERWLAASSHAYGRDADGIAAPAAFAERVAAADAFVHVQDTAEQDVLDADAFAEHEGGFAAAAASLGNRPALFHVDATRADTTRVRTLAEEIARVVRARATNPKWIAGQMRHGHRGAAEIAETIGNLLAFAATTEAVAPRAFDLLFDATLGDERVRDFMVAANPRAAAAAARSFDEALRRGFWLIRRNSVAGRIAELLEADR
jgi:cobaltochelatase CobN